jgi:hypothetical protein
MGALLLFCLACTETRHSRSLVSCHISKTSILRGKLRALTVTVVSRDCENYSHKKLISNMHQLMKSTRNDLFQIAYWNTKTPQAPGRNEDAEQETNCLNS